MTVARVSGFANTLCILSANRRNRPVNTQLAKQGSSFFTNLVFHDIRSENSPNRDDERGRSPAKYFVHPHFNPRRIVHNSDHNVEVNTFDKKPVVHAQLEVVLFSGLSVSIFEHFTKNLCSLIKSRHLRRIKQAANPGV
jgi:hypothetical protein